MIRIVLVDDHKLVRDGIRAQLEGGEQNQYSIIGEASNGKEALEILKTLNPDVVIMDINMEGMDGITSTDQISKLYPDVKVLALTMLDENQHIKQMLKAGASGYLLKNCGEKELKKAIDTLYKDGTYYSPQVTKVIMNSLINGQQKTSSRKTIIVPLTSREKEVLRLILQEYSNKEIANELFISTRTVDAHKRNLLEKTGSKNIAGLVLYAFNNHLFDHL